MKLYFAVAFDLKRSIDGGVVVGPGTAQACQRACELVTQDPKGYFVATAGYAPLKWDNVHMAECMQNYALLCGVPADKIIIGCGPTFNTDGEMRELARIAKDCGAEKICIVVKWWHAPRTWFLAWYHLRRQGVFILPRIKLHKLKVGWKCICKEFFCSIPKMLWRILLEVL